VEPRESVSWIEGGHTSVRTTVTLNLQPIKLLTRWLDELPDIEEGLDRWSSASREYTQYLGPADSPVSHNNFYDRLVTRPTAQSGSDSGAEHVLETPPHVNEERSCVTYDGATHRRGYMTAGVSVYPRHRRT